jgi:hypothetical protein
MKRNHTPARAREAAEWLAAYDPDDGLGKVGPQAHDPGTTFTQPVVIAAFAAGADQADAEWAIERSTGQRQLDDAGALMREAAELLRGYEAHHGRRAETYAAAGLKPKQSESLAKAERNALMASRLEAWLRGEDHYPVTLSPVEHVEFVRDQPGLDCGGRVTRDQSLRRHYTSRGDAHPLYDNIENFGTLPPFAYGERECRPRLRPEIVREIAKRTNVALTTPDPRFDPLAPLTVNGYLFRPAKEA